MIATSGTPAGDHSPSLADLKRELADLRAEREEAQAREAAITEILQIINSSPGNPAPVFDAILERAHALCGATLGSLMQFDGEKFRLLAAHGNGA